MDLFMVLQLLCGLALFLFGMNSMGDGLESLSGGKLEKTLEKMTNSTMKGFILGMAVTAVIQSSSATTVMVVGFVNSGIMKLRQAIGIIMGANVGTTTGCQEYIGAYSRSLSESGRGEAGVYRERTTRLLCGSSLSGR